MPERLHLVDGLPSIEIPVTAFRIAVLSVMPFCEPDHHIGLLSGVRFTVTEDAVVTEAVNAHSAAQARIPLTECSVSGVLDRVIPAVDLNIILANLQHAVVNTVRLIHSGGDEDDLLTVELRTALRPAFTADVQTNDGARFPLRSMLANALREVDGDEPCRMDTDPATLTRLTQAMSTTGHPAAIYPGPRAHVATAGDRFIAVLSATPARGTGLPTGTPVRELWRHGDAPPVTDLATWRERF